ncbi:MAG: ATP-dependent DNA helicase [Bifidobacteriaceae bacterium]|jgi:ATP-dependent DNA helicase DinG|nr:ATP-dependent DNA helicase [Bifidobacteriaceae bacterium]
MKQPPDVAKLLATAVEKLGGRHRAGQTEMAEAVWSACERGRHLLVQAGTGTGKSLAYLVPALAYAAQAGQPVVVATATLALQRQIVDHDLPLARAAVEPAAGRELAGAVAKGRHNYVCRHKLAGGYGDEDSDLFDLVDGAGAAAAWPAAVSLTGSPLAEEVGRLNRWARRTATGDRDDFPGGVSAAAWRQVSVRSAQCLGGKCPLVGDCFAEAARAAAGRADLVVTNHAMLAIDAAGRSVLPEWGALVIDEAHNLVQSLTSTLTASLGAEQVAAAAARAGRVGCEAADLVAAGSALESALAGAPVGRQAPGMGEALTAAVGQVRAAARAALSQVMTAGAEGGEQLGGADAAARQLASAALEEVAETARRLEDEAGGDVRWIGPSALGPVSLQAAPLDVAERLRATVLEPAPAVMTSATLALGGSLERAARSFGLSDDEWDGIDVGSPFDYGRQAILYLPRDLPAPGQGDAHWAAQHARLRELIEASRGGALGLFTSRRAAEAAAEALRPELDFAIGVQGEKSLPALIEDFTAEPEACLFGTISLWQGVDAPGVTCRLVTIDRLAFPRPDDPVMSARAEAADKAGDSGFMAVSAAHAALMLAQGAGRLIRSAEDRGVVAILDPRIATRRYGEFLARSLPPMWRTSDLAVVLGALARLAAQA